MSRWSGRGRITDEYIAVMRRLWAEGSIDHAGDEYSCAGLQLCPQPESRIPIWIGGEPRPSYRRAGRLGDGWLPAFPPPEGYAAPGRRCASTPWPPAGNRRRSRPPSTRWRRSATGGRGGGVLDPFMRSVFGAPLEALGFACLYGTPDRWVDTIGRFGRPARGTC